MLQRNMSVMMRRLPSLRWEPATVDDHLRRAIPDASLLDYIPGVRQLRLRLYRDRPDTTNFKTRHAEWLLMRSRWRHVHALYPYMGPPSYTLLRLALPISIIMFIAVSAYLWDKFAVEGHGWWTPNEGDVFRIVFQLTSFCMSLLLAFRINRAYDRWWASRIAFSNVGNGCVSLMTQAATNISDPYLLAEFQRWLQVWHLSIMQCVLDCKKPDPRTKALLSEDDLKIYSGSRKPRQLCMTKMTMLAKQCNLGFAESMQMETTIQRIAIDHGVCCRIFYTAMPYAISLHTTGFVFIWCMLLPLGLYPGGNEDALLAALMAALLLLGTDEVANALEQPFDHLPLEDMIQTTLRDIPRVLEDVALLRQLAADAAEGAKPGSTFHPPPPTPAGQVKIDIHLQDYNKDGTLIDRGPIQEESSTGFETSGTFNTGDALLPPGGASYSRSMGWGEAGRRPSSDTGGAAMRASSGRGRATTRQASGVETL